MIFCIFPELVQPNAILLRSSGPGEEALGLMLVIFMIQDSFKTATNIIGDGAIALIKRIFCISVLANVIVLVLSVTDAFPLLPPIALKISSVNKIRAIVIPINTGFLIDLIFLRFFGLYFSIVLLLLYWEQI